MKTRCITPMRVAKIGYIAMSAVFCAVGVLFVARPDIGSTVLGLVLGISMIAFGVIKIVGYFSKDLYRLAFQYDLEIGIILSVLGVVMLIKPISAVNFIFIAMGVVILADALFKLRIAFDAKKFGIGQWWVILILAALTGVAGILMMFRPWESLNALTILLGISLLAEGLLNFVVAVSTVKIVKNQYPDYIDAYYTEIMEESD